MTLHCLFVMIDGYTRCHVASTVWVVHPVTRARLTRRAVPRSRPAKTAVVILSTLYCWQF